MMPIFSWLRETSQKRSRARYERNKLRKIAAYAEKYGVKTQAGYSFQSGTREDEYLRMLKEKLQAEGVTMLGSRKLDTLRHCAEQSLREGIAGDFIETGVWKGGATILLAGVLHAWGNKDKKVFVADSFAGLPPPDVKKYPLDKGDTHYTRTDLAIGLDEVKANFARFELLSDQVVFLKGFFEESLRTASIDNLALLRLDGDMYGSTMTVLEQLYHKLSIGGYLILDDWLLSGARQALLDFRDRVEITEPLCQDFSGVYWQKTKTTKPPPDPNRR
ncbi:MAG: macrocin O-methyltransferase [Desulfofustis sp.]|nr:macrocin O-methyltransferase [Desulfofustis sp.]